MRILGVDPGLRCTGYGVIEANRDSVYLLEGGVIRPNSKGKDLKTQLTDLYQGIVEVVEEMTPQAMALEELHSRYDFPKTAILMAHARGVIYLAAAQRHVPVFSYEPTQVKHALTGFGRASKDQIQRAIASKLSLNTIPHPNDVADALALALCHHMMITSPLIVEQPGI